MALNNAINSKQLLDPTASPTFNALTLTTPLTGTNGGTGVNNGSSTITLGGNLTTSGAFASTFTMTGATNVTFPTSGTLATTASIPSLPLSAANGGTGVSNSSTITVGGAISTANSFTTSGNFALTLTQTGATNVTLPTSGTLATTAGTIPSIGSSTDKGIVTWNGTSGNAVQNNANLVTTAAGEMLGGVGSATNCTFSFNSHANYGMFYTTNTLNLAANGTSWFTIGSGGTCTAQAGLTATGLLANQAGRQGLYSSSSSTSLSINNSSHFIGMTSTSARTATLPSNSAQGQYYVIIDSGGNAGTNNITVSVSGGVKTINNAASFVINTNYGAARFVYDGTNYFTW